MGWVLSQKSPARQRGAEIRGLDWLLQLGPGQTDSWTVWGTAPEGKVPADRVFLLSLFISCEHRQKDQASFLGVTAVGLWDMLPLATLSSHGAPRCLTQAPFHPAFVSCYQKFSGICLTGSTANSKLWASFSIGQMKVWGQGDPKGQVRGSSMTGQLLSRHPKPATSLLGVRESTWCMIMFLYFPHPSNCGPTIFPSRQSNHLLHVARSNSQQQCHLQLWAVHSPEPMVLTEWTPWKLNSTVLTNSLMTLCADFIFTSHKYLEEIFNFTNYKYITIWLWT